MNQVFFTNLPTEIIIEIVSRLPIRSIMSCKCVCKSWRDLIKTCEFVDSHSSLSVPCLAVFHGQGISNPYRVIEFVDTESSGQNHCNMVLEFSCPHQTIVHSSANGLLFLIDPKTSPQNLFICNPITREYIKLPPTAEVSFHLNFGFGVSKLTGEYKVVKLFYDQHNPKFYLPCISPKCEVYSLRRGLWRSVAGDQLRYAKRMSLAVFLLGNLHWLVGPYSEGRFKRILCFDLETECLSTFSVPHLDCGSMCALRDCLCLCDSSLDSFVIWLMNEYGDDKSWRKEFVIGIYDPYIPRRVVPIKVFKDGDILFVCQYSSSLYCYSSKTRTMRVIIEADAESYYVTGTRPIVYTPSFVPLKTFTSENNVISF